ncbi:MAG: DNA methyltransferase [Bdellovibrionales bacterium]|nr:DNA methyltransferase [Bdellovibrionales bacterium]
MDFLHQDISSRLDEKKIAKTRANDLSGKEWLKNSVSIWSDLSKDNEERKMNHPAIFPWKLAYKIIETFTDHTRKNILDPFLGSGSTLIACHKLNKNGIGFDINKEYISLSKKRIKDISASSKNNPHIKLIKSTALNIRRYLPDDTIDLCFTSPPYWDILSQKRTVDGKSKKEYSFSRENIGLVASYEEYLLIMKNIFREIFKVMKPNSYCIINVMDLRKKNVFYPLHMNITDALTSIGYILDDIIIWDRKQDYNNLRPLGYPYVFRVNKIHEFLLIFKKCQN